MSPPQKLALKHTERVSVTRAPERKLRRGWTVRTRLLVALLLVAALGLTAAGATTFLLQYQRAVSSLDASLRSRVNEAYLVVLGASNSQSASAPPTAPQPFHSARAAVEAAISRVLPNSDESTLGIVDSKATFVPGVTTDFTIAQRTGLVKRVVAETADGKTYLGTFTDSTSSFRYIAA